MSRNGCRQNLRLLASLLALLEVAGVCATAAEEWTNDGVFVCLVKNIIVDLDSPRWGVELRPVDLQSISNLANQGSRPQ
jgi:hypothetical protein